MKPNPFDLRIIEIVGALRILAGEKQANLALQLHISQPEICKIERGQRALTLGHLQEICNYLHVSIVQVVDMANASLTMQFKETPLPVLLYQFCERIHKTELLEVLGRRDFEFILKRIKERNTKVVVVDRSDNLI